MIVLTEKLSRLQHLLVGFFDCNGFKKVADLLNVKVNCQGKVQH